MYYYTYKIVSEMPDKPYYYYGVHCTNNLEDGYLGSGLKLKRFYDKYGTGAFRKEILQFYDSKEEAYLEEVKLIGNLFETDKWCLNLRSGGKGGSSKEDWSSGKRVKNIGERNPRFGKVNSEETRKKISESNKGRISWNKGLPSKVKGRKIFTEESKLLLSEKVKKKYSEGYINPMKGRTHSEETKNKISKLRQGKSVSEETKKKISNSHKGKTLSEETKSKLLKIHLGSKRSEESRARMRGRLGSLSKINKPIDQFTKEGIFIKTYESTYSVKRELGISAQNVNACVKKKIKSAGGYIWKYNESQSRKDS